MVDRNAHLEAIAHARDSILNARRDLRDAVNAARADGVTWPGIGETLGITKQAAYERFGNPRRARHLQGTGRED